MDNTPKTAPEHRTWGTKDVFIALSISFVFAQVLVAIIFVIVSQILGSDKTLDILEENPWASLSLTGLSAASMLTIIYLYMRKLKFSVSDLGFKKNWGWSTTAYVLIVYVIYIFLSSAVAAIVSLLTPSFNPDEVQDVGFKSAEGWQLILAFIGLVVIPPIAEEFVFRGFAYKGLKAKWKGSVALFWGIGIALVAGYLLSLIAGLVLLALFTIAYVIGKKHRVFAAALVTSTLFGLVHMQWNIAIDTFVFSFALIYVLEKTKNLWASVALHALKNGIAFIYLFIISK